MLIAFLHQLSHQLDVISSYGGLYESRLRPTSNDAIFRDTYCFHDPSQSLALTLWVIPFVICYGGVNIGKCSVCCAFEASVKLQH